MYFADKMSYGWWASRRRGKKKSRKNGKRQANKLTMRIEEEAEMEQKGIVK